VTNENEVLVITPEEKRELETDLSALISQGGALVVKDDESMQRGVELLSWQARALKKIEERRQFFVKPLNEHVSRINLFFKNFSVPLTNTRAVIEPKILNYRREKEEARRKEEMRIQREQNARQKELEKEAKKIGQVAPVPLPKSVILPQAQTTFSDSGSATAKKVWRFKVLKESDIPIKYFTLDEMKIRAAIREGIRNIQGLEIYQEESLAIKA